MNSSTPIVLPCACASLRRAARAVTQLYDDALRGSGLRSTQFTLLQVLDRAGEMLQGELGEVLAIDSTTLTRSLAPLAKGKLLAVRTGDDQRERLWSITSTGKRRLASLTPAWQSVQARLRGEVGERHWQEFLNELATVASSAAALQ